MTSKAELSGQRPQLDVWLAEVASGNERAVAPLYSALLPIVLRHCERALGKGPDAEDAAQSALIKLFEQAPDYDQKTPAVAWALAIAYWQCRTIRSRARRQKDKTELNHDMDYGHSLDPETLLAQSEVANITQNIVSQLAEEDRILLGLDSSAIGQALINESPATQRKRKQRLLARLHEAFLAIVSPRSLS